jgi:hypothetical protein
MGDFPVPLGEGMLRIGDEPACPAVTGQAFLRRPPFFLDLHRLHALYAKWMMTGSTITSANAWQNYGRIPI